MAKYSKLFKQGLPDQVENLEELQPEAEASERFTLLFVDDEENVLKALKRVFLEENYNLLVADNADQALELIDREKGIQLVISDFKMPGMNGVDLLREIKRKRPEIIRIMLTGHADVQAVMGAVNEGAVYKFITKPWSDEDLRLSVSLALQQYVLLKENKILKDITKKQQIKIKNFSALYDKDRKALGNILIKQGILKPEDLLRAQKEKRDDEFIIETIIRLGFATDAKIIKALQSHLSIEFIDIKETHINPAIVRSLPKDFCERSRFIPVRLEGNNLTVAMADPSDIFLRDNIEFLTGLRVFPLIAGSADILKVIRQSYGENENGQNDDIDIMTGIEPMDEIDIVIDDEDENINVQELLNSSEVPPIIRVVNAIISEAIRYKASDIHIEPKTKFTLIRYRIDGILHAKIKLPIDYHASTISRIKILSKMDISERRKPQDGRFTVKAGTRLVDLRVSTLPTINGEKATLRILDKSSSIRQLQELGILQGDLDKIHHLIKRPQGIIITTGPTGSGKTTLLYSILNTMMQPTKNFETIEDPVEYFLEDASQVYIRDKLGLSFANVLRSTMRQDPDVILVGEIRDLETADVVFKAGMTGHMVLSTLHTNSSVSSITRLIDIGVKPYLISSTLEGIIAQRLVRKICRSCKEEIEPDAEMMRLLNFTKKQTGEKVFRGKGCQQCGNTGYNGRVGLFEIFVMNDDFRHIISSNYRESDVLNLATSTGMYTLIDAGIAKVKSGDTTLEEMIRVLGPQTKHEYKCPSCSEMIDMKFLFCPFCGNFKHNVCKECKMPLEEEWIKCPFCGEHKDK
jgi:type II secretory ATPase GspE/PulE/Tfp pilus assembly ATPase PilB-like protein/FixJ family two-component response regulator